ncbi:MAG: hypothetical protein ACUVXA_14170 [Candidatus Jordarchaeum sp.]
MEGFVFKPPVLRGGSTLYKARSIKTPLKEEEKRGLKINRTVKKSPYTKS